MYSRDFLSLKLKQSKNLKTLLDSGLMNVKEFMEID